MLKTRFERETWLVHQPDHARVSGYLAAHWGNQEFSRPGSFAPTRSADVFREHVVLAIAEHDNGWWEWEAFPEIDLADGLPLHLPDVARTSLAAGLQRWRLGVPRLSDHSPYASLLISLHAYWLYAFAFEDLPGLNNALRHPVFGQRDGVQRIVNDPQLTREFLSEQSDIQNDLMNQLRNDEVFSAAVMSDHLLPHVRMLQLMDALSLSLSFGGRQPMTVTDIPCRSWNDRVTLHWTPVGDRRIVCEPYPFDVDPLPVDLPVRVLSHDEASLKQLPLVQLHATPLRTVQFQICSNSTTA